MSEGKQEARGTLTPAEWDKVTKQTLNLASEITARQANQPQEAPSTAPVRKCSCDPIHKWECDFHDERSAQWIYRGKAQPESGLPREVGDKFIVANGEMRFLTQAISRLDDMPPQGEAEKEGRT